MVVDRQHNTHGDQGRHHLAYDAVRDDAAMMVVSAKSPPSPTTKVTRTTSGHGHHRSRRRIITDSGVVDADDGAVSKVKQLTVGLASDSQGF